MSVDNKTLGRFVLSRCKQARIDAGLTCQQLGDRMYGPDNRRVGLRKVSQFENRQGAVSMLTLWKIAEALKMDWRDLLPPPSTIKRVMKDDKD